MEKRQNLEKDRMVLTKLEPSTLKSQFHSLIPLLQFTVIYVVIFCRSYNMNKDNSDENFVLPESF